MVRRWLIVIGFVEILIAVLLIGLGLDIAAVAWLVITGAILVVAIVFERRGYRPRVDRTHVRWQPTGERFIDPSSGHLIEVRFDPKTGARDYVDLGPAP